jgi:FixJ family two-component response regulator
MLTSFADEQALVDSIMAGAAGYVLKQIRRMDLIEGIRRVARGESLLDSAVTARVLHQLRHPSAHGDSRLARLTPTELRIVEMIADGMTNRMIGERIGLACPRSSPRCICRGGRRRPRTLQTVAPAMQLVATGELHHPELPDEADAPSLII